MLYTVHDLGNKNVVNLCDGKILGCVCDIEVNTDCGKVTAVIISGNKLVFSFCSDMIRIPWECVKCVGEDTILVEYRKEICSENYSCGKKRGWLFGLL